MDRDYKAFSEPEQSKKYVETYKRIAAMVGMDYHNSYGVIERVGDAIEDSIKYRNSKILEYEEFARAVGTVKRLLSELILNDKENIG